MAKTDKILTIIQGTIEALGFSVSVFCNEYIVALLWILLIVSTCTEYRLREVITGQHELIEVQRARLKVLDTWNSKE